MPQQTCPTCSGQGAVANQQTGSPETCPNCQGTGATSTGLADLPFWYLINVTLTSGQLNVGGSVTVDNDADFEWRWLISTSILATGAAGLFSIQLTDRFTSRPMTGASGANASNFVNGENMFGTAQLPFTLPKPYLLRRTSTVAVLLNERSAAGVNNNVQLALVGYKLS
ncbi:MAG TPA: hypothetical protein VNJ12_13395 [Candidatus Dormibacteraeota bacterium]|nr:hypothetical protein [Candidatus Dormibacteraeota bacterium]